MRTYHYAIIFAIIAIIFVTIRDIAYAEVSTAMDKKREYDRCFSRAIDVATNELIIDVNGCIFSSRDAAYTTLLNSLYSSLDLLMDTEGKQRLELFLPVVAIVDEDGIYLCYLKESTEPGKKLERVWTERIPYKVDYHGTQYEFTLSGKAISFDEELNRNIESELTQELEALRLDTISSVVEQKVTEYMNQHNHIARQYGIQYEFHVSLTDDSFNQRSITNPSLLVMFQGYPLLGKEHVFDSFSFAGASIRKHDSYIVTKKDWYYEYHRKDCENLKEVREREMDTEEMICNSKKECAMYGAFPCPDCMDPTGDYSYLQEVH